MSYTEFIPNEVSDQGELDQAEPSSGPDGRPGGPQVGGPQVGDMWQTDKNGKAYIRRAGRRGLIYRQGDETIEQAFERDAKPRDKRPGSSGKPKTARKPPPPAKADLKDLERELAEALRSPAMICATFGDAWAADHFTNQGPVLARNLVVAAEHNPWLRRQLEAATHGGDAMMRMVTLVGVGGAQVGYAIPPVIYWFNLPVPEQARLMFGIPPRREKDPDDARGPQAFPAAA